MSRELLNIEYKKFQLDNGLEVVLYKSDTLPLVSVNLWYRVGSANERNGKTGFAHLFEHMMFQGSQNVDKEMHFKHIQEAGGSLNGSTSFDRTNYYETLPSNNLDLALWLESDRMGFMLQGLTQKKLDNQKDVVMNERRQRYENQPYGLSWELIFSNIFPENHPYHWPTIGWMEDIEKFNLQDVKDFFNVYYTPNNASLVIGGNIDYDTATKQVEKYFGEIPRGTNVPEINVPAHEFNEIVKIEHKDNVQLPRIYFTWHSAKYIDSDDASLDVLADVLCGTKNSRLQNSLIFEKQIAQEVVAFQYSGNLAGLFIVVATPKPGVEIDVLKDAVFSELNSVISDGITQEELDLAKNGTKSSFIYSLQNLEYLVNQINNYNYYFGEPNSFYTDLERTENVTIDAVQQVAKKYLTNPYLELNIIPK
jgi:zinc protease